jgi:hypothetical protein
MLVYTYTACLVTTSSLSYCMVYTLLVITNCVHCTDPFSPRVEWYEPYSPNRCMRQTYGKKPEQLLSYWLCATFVGGLPFSMTLLRVQSSTTHQQDEPLGNKLYTVLVLIDGQTLRPCAVFFYCAKTRSYLFCILCLICGSVPA